MISLSDIQSAQKYISGKLNRTPMLSSSTFSKMTGLDLRFKAEIFQKTGSFKPRGVLNKVRSLTADERAKGLIAVSAGNHAQAVAYAAQIEQIKATVVMPQNAVRSKAEATRGYGAEVILYGEMKDLFPHASELIEQHGFTMIHPFDDPLIMAGQGTVGLEIIKDVPDVDVVVVPIGGGGLISGIASALKLSKPNVKVYGVEPVGASTMLPSLNAGKPISIDEVNTIADGLSAPFAGTNTLAVVRDRVDEVVLVDDHEIASALKLLVERSKVLAEPAGAAGLAALLSGKLPIEPDSKVVCVLSGGNLDLDRIEHILALGDKNAG